MADNCGGEISDSQRIKTLTGRGGMRKKICLQEMTRVAAPYVERRGPRSRSLGRRFVFSGLEEGHSADST